MHIKPIETHYAGCRFRSRLEARWAVFFDTLGIEWEYEPQGYEADGGVRYLPDFWIEEFRLFVEVKGRMSHRDLVKIMGAAPQLLDPPDRQITPRLLILGPVPRPGWTWTHSRIDVIGDRLLLQNVYFHDRPGWHTKPIGQAAAFPIGAFEEASEDLTRFFCESVVDPAYDDRLAVHPEVDRAYAAARSARFEFGQTPRGPGEF